MTTQTPFNKFKKKFCPYLKALLIQNFCHKYNRKNKYSFSLAVVSPCVSSILIQLRQSIVNVNEKDYNIWLDWSPVKTNKKFNHISKKCFVIKPIKYDKNSNSKNTLMYACFCGNQKLTYRSEKSVELWIKMRRYVVYWSSWGGCQVDGSFI